MKPLKEYQIPFLGLKRGVHEFEFTLTNKFFEAFDNSETGDAHINVKLSLDKQTTMMLAHFNLEGTVTVTCDRCGDEMVQAIGSQQELIIKFGAETKDSGDDVIVLGPQEYELDVSQYLYEYALLSIPARRVHPNPEDCNQEAVKALEKYRVDTAPNTQWADLKNLNYEDPEDQEFIDEEE